MRFSLAVAVVLLGFSMSGVAQQDNTFKVKPSTAKKPPSKSAPIGINAAGSKPAASATSKDLQSLERQTARASALPRPAAKKTAPTLKPAKEERNPPINFTASGRAKSAAPANKNPDPSAGRLKEKGGGH